MSSAVSSELHAGFARPDPAYSPVPIWWWSGEPLELERMKWQIDQLVAQGVYNAVVLNLAPTGPTYGSLSDAPHMTTPEWWQIWDALCAYSRHVGMRLWFYDQFGFSGANLQGRLAVDNPSFVGMALHREVAEVEAKGEIACPAAGIPIAAQAVPLDAQGRITGAPINLTLKDGTATWTGEGRARLMLAYALRKGFDYHSPEACAALINIVHGEFERRLAQYFGTSLVGSFQDELPSVPSWSARFEQQFEQRCGYPIGPKIAALWEDWGLESARVRIDYQRVRAALAEEALFKPLFDWHERHGLVFGVDQQSPARAAEPLGATDQYADYARTHRWYSAPGSDHWGDAKFHSSIAHSYGRPRTWIECFHSSGWGGTLEETFDWLQPWLLAGANLYDPHAVYYSTKGGQWEWAAPSTCWRQPYWRHYKHFADTISRLCWLATRGEHVCDVGVLFPSAAVQADLFLDHAGSKGRAAHWAYMELLGSMIWFNQRKGVLARLLRDFDVLDDDTVAGASIEPGALRTRGERYKAVVVPNTWLVEAPTLETLIAFAEAGGLLIVVDDLPSATDDKKSDALLARLRALLTAGKVRLIKSGDELRAGLEDALRTISAEVVSDSPTLLRRDGEISMLFVTAAPEGSATAQPMHPWAIWDYDNDVFPMSRYNSEMREKGYDFDPSRNRDKARIRIAGEVGAIEQWDPATGKAKPARVVHRSGINEVVVDFAESPMSVLVWSRSGQAATVAEDRATTRAVMHLPDVWQSRIVPTIDNRHGDFTLPANPGPLPVEAWAVRYHEDESAVPGLDWSIADWERVPVTDGPRGWMFGPAAKDALPAPMSAGQGGPLGGRGWSPVTYSLSRGIDHDAQHDNALGPKSRVPEPFVRLGAVNAGEAIQLRTALPVGTAGRLTLAIGGNGIKDVWWNGKALAPDAGGYLMMEEVDAGAGDNLLELRLTAVADGPLSCYWALTTDREAFERPEWLEPADGWQAGTIVTMRKSLELSGDEDLVAHFGSEGVATLLVNGNEVAMHGAFEPYAGWRNQRIIKYALTPHLKPGRNEIEARFTDAGTPIALYFDGTVTSRNSNRPASIVSDKSWIAERNGKPIDLALQANHRQDPRFFMMRPRPHPLPRTGWLEPEQPIAGVLDIVPEPRPGELKLYQWFAVDVPPGATRIVLPAQGAELALFDAGTELHVTDGGVSLDRRALKPRQVLVRAKVADGRIGGAVWDGPIVFEVGEGEITLGPWAENGLEFWSGGVEYRHIFSTEAPDQFSRLDLGKVRGTAEVEINGILAGVRVWSPYGFDIGGKLRAGENTIVVRVFNTLAPYLKGASPTRTIFKGQDVSGLMGPVSLS